MDRGGADSADAGRRPEGTSQGVVRRLGSRPGIIPPSTGGGMARAKDSSDQTTASTTGAEAKGRDLFIVDNSVSGWTALRYLEEWAGIAKSFDIAVANFWTGRCLRKTTPRLSALKKGIIPLVRFVLAAIPRAMT